jgi:hypothetical protein
MNFGWRQERWAWFVRVVEVAGVGTRSAGGPGEEGPGKIAWLREGAERVQAAFRAVEARSAR